MFSPLSFVAVFGSGIRDPRSGMGKIRIRDKHPGSATLVRIQAKLNSYLTAQCTMHNHCTWYEVTAQ